MTVLADWVHAAFEAARRHDDDAAIGALNAITNEGRPALIMACMGWIDRTHLVMELTNSNAIATGQIHLRVLSDHGDVGNDVIKPFGANRWACRMFVARVTEDAAMWRRLTTNLPDDRLYDYAFSLLRAMALTAMHYAENPKPAPDPDDQGPCCIYHRIVDLMDPMLCATRHAVAHLN